jgi:hypothetical protein
MPQSSDCKTLAAVFELGGINMLILDVNADGICGFQF